MDEVFSDLALFKLKGDINVQTRTVIHNVLTVFNELKSNPQKISSLNLNKPRDITALLCGVSTRTVDKVKKEILESGHPSTPREMYVKPQTVTNIEKFDVCLLQNTITSLYDNGEHPTTAKILQKLREQQPELKCGKSSLKKIIKKTGCQYKKKHGPSKTTKAIKIKPMEKPNEIN